MTNDDYGYQSAMDREPIIPINQVGTSTNPFQHQTEALKARIFHGASRIEFSFFGAGKSNKEQPSPEAFGKREREDMRNLAEYNKVETSTHASVAINGLSGMDQNKFSDEKRKSSVDELKRAIEFASEATTGGAVVFHTGEAPRGMNTTFNGQFKLYKDEDGREQHFIASRRQKALVSEIRENTKQYLPVKKLDKNGDPIVLKDIKGKDIFDNLTGEKLYEYELDKESGGVKLQEKYFKEYKLEYLDDKHHLLTNDEKKELEKINNRNLTEKDKIESISKIEQKFMARMKDKEKNNPDFYRLESKEAAIDFHKRQMLMQVQYQLSMARHYEQEYQDKLEDFERMKKSYKYYKELKDKLPAEEWEKVKKETGTDRFGFTPPKNLDPVEYLEKGLKASESGLEQTMDMIKSGKGRAMEILSDFDLKNTLNNGPSRDFVAAEDFARERATQSMAEAAIFAMEKTEARIKEDKRLYPRQKSKLEDNPLYISPEAWQPETYGGHPDEIKRLVLEARENMSDELQRVKGFSKHKADEAAQTHIKATLDIGHMNVWKKYYVKKEGESQEQYDKRFKGWVIEKTKDLAKHNIVGHAHLSDNYGYNDEHLTIGDGNAPVKEFIKALKDAGVKEFIVESGSFNPMIALPHSWDFLGSPVYNVFKPGFMDQTWADGIIQGGFHHSYFGKTEHPRYLMGDLSPSEEYKGAPFYSGTPLE